MSFEFESENTSTQFTSQIAPTSSATPRMVKIVQKLGIQSEKKAGYLLLTFAIIALLASIVIFAKAMIKPNNSEEIKKSLERMSAPR